MKQNKVIIALATACALTWIVAAINPLDRQAWVLENVLLVIFVVAFGLTHRRLELSTASYVCIALFVLLHVVGAHYTYAKMPLGLWAKHFFGLSRNHFDRVAHFGFGFFLAFPLRELLGRFSGMRRAWSFWLAAAVVLAVSGLFEMIESVVAAIIAPGKGADWLGGQGDEWDAQNDMLSAFLGALLMMAIVAVFGKTTDDATAARSRGTVGPGARDTRPTLIALGCYVAFWMALAIHPLDRGDWLLENLLIFISVIVLAATYPHFRFSNLSYLLILLFLTFHTIGAHYTYAKVPAGFWLQDWLHLSRNHYDRVIHFSFGFLLLYPMRELLLRSARTREPWAIWLSVAALAALSSFFEIIEAVVAQIVRPDLGTAYLGTQGDIWDAQKDMAAAFIGALVVAAVLGFRRDRAAAQIPH